MNVIKIHMRLFSNSSKLKAKAAVRVAQQGPVRIITMDRPKQMNAVNLQMWQGLAGAINEAEKNISTSVIAIRGNENCFCSGFDLIEYKEAVESNSTAAYAKNVAELLRILTAQLIDSKKPIVGLVRGPAVGFGATMLPMFDLVYASDKATFATPFARLGIIPECCSSYTFPRVMGYARAASMLYDNQTINATQALQWGLITDVISEDKFDPETTLRVDRLAQLPLKALLHSKTLFREPQRKMLHEMNLTESQAIEKYLQSSETIEIVQNLPRRKK